jgi:hypothetical protein
MSRARDGRAPQIVECEQAMVVRPMYCDAVFVETEYSREAGRMLDRTLAELALLKYRIDALM